MQFGSMIVETLQEMHLKDIWS